MADDSSETSRLLKRAAEGDSEGWGLLLERYRERLRRMVALRLDQRLQGRIDASDVIQEAYLEAWNRLPNYLRESTMPFYLWLRFLTCQQVLALHRVHLGREMRNAAREISLYNSALLEVSSATLAAQLMGDDTRPSEAARRTELKLRLQEALNQMDAIDREVIALRHFEQLSRAETAELLGIRESAVSKRYVRALERLRGILADMPGGLGEVGP
jgi:RNA polymerase sigma-70 factor (ECF subfamily)